ncbi:hypothetical protein [Croceicoccus sp. BE223]|uniref:hypothetical protein n=1 Tax=Croceicoccus sp. BE223 TaxID=2817716 RepID=UPI002866CBB5|nr:hypothetical protein [Croceicoccus sp. BE223]MDR7103009.1 hypothetical protein [Croceicoccus sp. BE223]
MIRALLSALFGWLLRRFLPSQAQPTAEERAGRAEAKLESERAANAITTKGADVRADADARVMRGLTADDPKAELRKQFPGAFRD